MTFYRSIDDLPPFENYDMDGRTYRYFGEEVLYPFGFGLSYTTFEYSNIKITPDSHGPFGNFTVSVDVKNIGSKAGSEVVQLYLRDKISSVVRPVKELKGFSKILLDPNEIKSVEFELGYDELKMLDKDLNWVVEPGEFDIMVGSSSEDIRLHKTITIN